MSTTSKYLPKADEFIKTLKWSPESEGMKLMESIVVGNIYGFAGYLDKQPFTEPSTQEALAILDEVAALPAHRQDEAMQLIEWAAQKLRGVQVSPEDAELVALAKRHPIDLPWMQEGADLSQVPVPELQRVYLATGAEISRRPRDYSQPAVMAVAVPMCSPADCQKCQKGGETV